jgi:hypothetical protein
MKSLDIVKREIPTQTILKTVTAQSLGLMDKEFIIMRIDPRQLVALKTRPFPSTNPWETRIYAKSKIVTPAHLTPVQAIIFVNLLSSMEKN